MVTLVSMLATSQLAVSIVNWLVTLLVAPRSLPRMDYSGGIAPEARTLVAVPTLLTDRQSVQSLIEALEVRFLANRDPLLHFALLSDFPDAAEETLPTDAPLLQLAQDGINALNRAYCPNEQSTQRRHFLPAAPSAPLESAARRVDGLRTQARQAG